MTVGIVLTNGLESVVMTDSRVSGYGRQSDSVNKMGEFSNDKYSGVIFGTGSLFFLESVLKNLNPLSHDSLDPFVNSVFEGHKNRVDGSDKSYLDSERNEIEKKSKLIVDEQERKKFVQEKTIESIQRYDQWKQENQTLFVVSVYDKDHNKIRLYSINSSGMSEFSGYHWEIGSGLDGANLYFATKLQGIDLSKLNMVDLTYFLMNSYSTSTVNQGVGGKPKIAFISKKGTKVLPDEKVNVLSNLSGAYLSELNSELNRDSVRAHVASVLKGNKNYASIARALGVNKDTLTSMNLPYSVWQERSNKLF